MKKLGICSVVGLLGLSMSVLADGSETVSNVPDSAYFAGLGGSYNSLNVAQNVYASGISDVSQNGAVVASGEAGGPATPYNVTLSTFAPELQFGYFKHFTNSNWLWGAKFLYNYLGATANNQNVFVPQVGTFTNTGAYTDTPFTGNVTIASAQTSVNSELGLMPFIGHSFKNSYVYFGIGPVVFDTETNIYDTTGYADVGGTHGTDITGLPGSFSNAQWMWGGAAELGIAYYISPTWFVDANYTYAATGWNDHDYSAPFASETDGYTDTGTLYESTSQRIIDQSVAVTINKSF